MDSERKPRWKRTVISKGDILYTSTVRPEVQAEIDRRTRKVKVGTTFMNLSILDHVRVQVAHILHPGEIVHF